MASFLEKRRLRAFAGVVARAQAHFAEDGATSLLDVGGGTGWLAEALGKGLTKVVVLEPRPRARAKGKRRRPQVDFVDGVAERIPFPDGSFSRVIAVGSLHHFADAPRGLAEMRRVTAPGGRLVIFEYSPDNGKGHFLVRFACHHSLRRPDELASMGARAGFEDGQAFQSAPGYLVLARAPSR